jgi:hypothetical protein
VPDLHPIGTDIGNEAFAIPKFNIAPVRKLLRFFDRCIIVGAIEYQGRSGKVTLPVNEKGTISPQPTLLEDDAV